MFTPAKRRRRLRLTTCRLRCVQLRRLAHRGLLGL